MSRKLFIVGHPGHYGGAASELNSQVKLWHKGFPELELHIIPTMVGYQMEATYQAMLDLGIVYHPPMDFSAITADDAVINFCSSEFLDNLELINQFTKRTVWVNCMTYLFDLEKKQAKHNLIAHYLYQRPQIRDDHQKVLKKLGANTNFQHFIPYFDDESLEFSVKEQEHTHIGRISRQDADKFSKDTLHIYEYITSPKWKQGHFLGWGANSLSKIGQPPGWIKTYTNQREFSVKSFYDTVDFIVQPTDTTENLPRIGFEAMHSGKPLVVDNRGGWQYMINHKVDGFLCDTPRDFIYYGTRLAFEPELRQEIAINAKKKALELSSFESSKESWEKVFEKVYA